MIDGRPADLHPHTGAPQSRPLYVNAALVIPPRTERTVSVDIPFTHTTDRAPSLVYAAREVKPGIFSINAVLPGYKPTAELTILNTTSRKRRLELGLFIGYAQPYCSRQRPSNLKLCLQKEKNQASRHRHGLILAATILLSFHLCLLFRHSIVPGTSLALTTLAHLLFLTPCPQTSTILLQPCLAVVG
jgi:hypothetical protein